MNGFHEQYDQVIKGNIVLPDRVWYNAQIAVKNGKIAGIFDEEADLNADHGFDATGQFVLPGAIDAHVHCFSALNEGFTHASRSAAAGGVTTIIEMPYDATGMICTKELFLEKKDRLQQESVVDIAMLATVPKEDGFDQVVRMAEAGACGFKVSMFNTNPFRFPRIDDGHLYELFSVIRETGCPVGVHAENDEIVRRMICKYANAGESDPRAHAWSRPKVAESVAALTLMELAYYTGVKLHLYHATHPRVFKLVAHFRSQGVRVTAETCTHYLTMHEDDMLALKAKAKINPPLRQKADMEELWNLAASGEVDLVTSDHAPWTMEQKTKPNIFENASGAPGVENLLPILYSEGVAKKRITILDLVRLLSENPAKVFGLDYCKGKIAPGMDADLVVLNPQESYQLDETSLHSTAGWSPYHGWNMQGKITHTFVRGQHVYNGQVIGKAGQGSYVPARHV